MSSFMFTRLTEWVIIQEYGLYEDRNQGSVQDAGYVRGDNEIRNIHRSSYRSETGELYS